MKRGDLPGMTDVAAQTLRTLSVVRLRADSILGARPAISLGVAGFAAATLTVVAGGRIGTVKTVIPLSSWLGLLAVNNAGSEGDFVPGTLMLAGIVALILIWLLAARVTRTKRVSERAVWCVAAVWALPFVVGPPLLSNDVYTYAAQGLMQRNGINVYAHGPNALGNVRALAAVDPSWRSSPSPYGTIATVVQHLAIAISGGSPIGAVIVLRGLAVACAAAIGLLAASLAGPRRVQALTLTVLNPLVLLQIVSAAHFEGVMCALLLAALVAANQRHWVLAIALGACASEVKAPALVVVLAIIAAHSLGGPPATRLRTGARDLLVAAVCFLALSLITPHGLGWIGSLNTPALGHTPLAPASLLGDAIGPIVRSASFDDLSTGGRISCLLAAGCAVLYLTLTAHHRAINRTTGYGLLAIGLLSPVVYAWYLLWGILCLAPTARAARRDWLLAGSAVACVYTPPGLRTLPGNIVTIVITAAALVTIGIRELRRRRELPAVLSAGG
jgi:hypothetical protein